MNSSDRFGRTPLHHAAKAGNIGAIKILLEKRGNSKGEIQINQLTIGQESPLIKACDSGQFEVAAVLCDCGADPTIKDVRDISALEYAQMSGN